MSETTLDKPSIRTRFARALPNAGSTLLPLVVLIALWAIAFFVVPGFGSANNISYLLQTGAYLGLVAIGQAMVVIMGGIDLSVPGAIALSAALCAQLFSEFGATLSITLALLACALVGAVNAAGVSLLRVPPMVMTLATGTMLSGALLILTNGQPASAKIPLLDSLANGHWAGVPLAAVLWLGVALIAYWIIHRTRSGRYTFALGSNAVASRASGVPVVTTTFIMYAACSVLAGIAGLVLLGFTGTSSLTMGNSYQLLSIAAVVLGGTSILGGKGSVVSAVVGALLITILTAVLSAYDVSEAIRRVIMGALIMALLLVYAREQKK